MISILNAFAIAVLAFLAAMQYTGHKIAIRVAAVAAMLVFIFPKLGFLTLALLVIVSVTKMYRLLH